MAHEILLSCYYLLESEKKFNQLNKRLVEINEKT